ncbi:MAG: radical SAM protein, partial [Bacteroidota bacterium]
DILKELLKLNPMVVGFSVIFENHLYDFQELIEYLRKNGIQSHFTAGGHFASLRPAELFEINPSLDSIVRFEGEHTILDLVNHLQSGEEWQEIFGISFRNNGVLKNNKLRALEPDLDNFPFPFRQEIKKYVFEKKYSTLIAGRGCVYNCAFCDIREFYRHPPGPVKRIRNPGMVVKEMEYLYKEHDCSVFLFQDDDFPVATKQYSGWIQEFCKSLRDRNLNGKIMWKINCRSDEIDHEIFDLMKQHGLFKVYLGIEDGTDAGLLQMNKRLKASDNIRGIQILKNLGISIDYGFMLFQPSSTYNSLNENLDFLEHICGDGYMPVSFLKMMPYLETRIEKELRKEGRLKGRPGFLDYDFYDRSIDDFYSFISECFNTWFNTHYGLTIYSKWAANYLSVFTYYDGSVPGIEHLSDSLRTQVSDANRFITETMKQLSALFESGNYTLKNDSILNDYRSSIENKHNTILEDVTKIMEKIELYDLTKDLLDW